MKNCRVPVTFDFNKKSYLSLIYDNSAGYETITKISSLFNKLDDVLSFDMSDDLNELLQLVIDYVISVIANQKCVKILIEK